MVFEYSAIRKTSYQSWFLVYLQLLHALLPPDPRLLQVTKLIIQITIQQRSQVKVWIDKHRETRSPLNQNPKTKKKWGSRTRTQGLKYRNGCKNSARILWMTEFLNAETHTRVLLMDFLQSLREVRIWVNTVFILIFRKTEIARSARAPQSHGPVQKTYWRSRTSCSEGCESRNNHRYAIVVQDLATQWIQSYPCKTKTSQETERSLQKILEPNRKPKVIYIDNSLAFGKACEDLSWNHCTSTPHISQKKGIAERAVRRVKEGTSAVLLQSGLNGKWWADSMVCETYLRNIQDLLSNVKTPYERRFGKPFKGPIIPFGSLVEYYQRPVKNPSVWKESLSWIVPRIRSVRGEKGDVLIADLEELETMDASEIYSKRLNAKEVIFSKK